MKKDAGLAAVIKEVIMFCSKCGKQLDERKVEDFCPYCGNKIKEKAGMTQGYNTSPSSISYAQGSYIIKKNAPGAVAGLVCGLIGIFFFGIIFGIIAIVMGNGAKKKVREQPELYTGDGMGTAAIVLGVIDLVCFFFIFLPIMISQ